MKRIRFADLVIEWDADGLPMDPIEPILPIEPAPMPPIDPDRPADITIRARAVAERTPDPTEAGAQPVLYHGDLEVYRTQCFILDGELLLWDRASTFHISADGRQIDVLVHPASIAAGFHFSSVAVIMTVQLALRSFGLYHLHASAAHWPGGETWVVPGESNAGKSTFALALFAAGAHWLSDDALMLRMREHVESRKQGDQIEVVGWGRLMRMTSQTAAAFPAIEPLLTPCPETSARDFEVDPRVAFPGRGDVIGGQPMALLFPRIGKGPDNHVEPLDQAEAFGRILHACAWVACDHLPGREAQLQVLRRMVEDARAFEVTVGARILTDPDAVVTEIRDRLR